LEAGALTRLLVEVDEAALRVERLLLCGHHGVRSVRLDPLASVVK
jgi:hypothetical protein